MAKICKGICRMKITKMPGFGSFGAMVSDFDWNDVNSYTALRQLCLENLVVVVRGGGVNRFDTFANYMYEIAGARNKTSIYEVYNQSAVPRNQADDSALWWLGDDYPGWIRVTGKKNNEGKYMGIFPEGELDWHVDYPGSILYYPLIVLYGYNGMKGTATAFLQTVDWFEEQSESFKSELKDMVAIYDFNNLQPNIDQQTKDALGKHFSANKTDRMPLVVKSPGGHTGFRYSATLSSIEGMNKAESDRIVNMLRKLINVPSSPYRYDYWWEHDQGDLLLIDNSVCVHKRLFQPNADITSVLSKRMLYRCSTDFSSDYQPYFIDHYSKIRKDQIEGLLEKNSFSINNWRQHFPKLKKMEKLQQAQYLKHHVSKNDLAKLIAALK